MKDKELHKYALSYDLQMFAGGGEGGDKTEEPTPKKLTDAREKGQVMRSTDITVALTLLCFFLTLKILGGFIGERLLGSFTHVYKKMTDYCTEDFTVNSAGTIVRDSFLYITITALPIFLVAMIVTILSILVQVKWKVTKEPMKPKFNKINPINGMKNLFSVNKLMELFKSTAKVIILAFVVYNYLRDQWAMVLDMYYYTLPQAVEIICSRVVDIGLRISIYFIPIAAADLLYQKIKFRKDMMMTKQEVKDEYKNSEGDPKVKSQQRARMQQASQRRMMQEVPNADVVITNPTHLAVAIRYDRDKEEAPIVTAKGADYLAEKIKTAARTNAVEIVENKPLARMLYHNVELGEEIPPELYQMVAEVLAYVYSVQGKIDR